jgi:zinc protease
LYWHSNYGSEISGNEDGLNTISEKDVADFKNKNYSNNRATLIIVGNVDKESALKEIAQHFGSKKEESKIDRLQEPPHHDSTVRISKYSSQVDAPIMELYWRIPNYRNEKDKALATEIFINHLDGTLQRRLIEQRIASSVTFSYSLWNYDEGDLCISIALRNSDDIENAIMAVTSEIKLIASEGLTIEQTKKATQKLTKSADVFRPDTDVFDFIDWTAQKVGSCHDFDFLKSYCDFANKFDLDKVNARAKAIFKKDPSVIAIIRPTNVKKSD